MSMLNDLIRVVTTSCATVTGAIQTSAVIGSTLSKSAQNEVQRFLLASEEHLLRAQRETELVRKNLDSEAVLKERRLELDTLKSMMDLLREEDNLESELKARAVAVLETE